MNDTIEYTLFSDSNDVIEQFDIDEDVDVLEYINAHISHDIHVEKWKYNHYEDIYYGIGKDCWNEDEVDYYMLCNANNVTIDTFKYIIESMINDNLE